MPRCEANLVTILRTSTVLQCPSPPKVLCQHHLPHQHFCLLPALWDAMGCTSGLFDDRLSASGIQSNVEGSEGFICRCLKGGGIGNCGHGGVSSIFSPHPYLKHHNIPF